MASKLENDAIAEDMTRLGLALSGGGFRATLYHLGVIRFLRDAGRLQHVSDIASVSGGSILAAHLVLNWDRYTGDDKSFAEAASEIIKFVQFDVRNHIVRRLPMQVPLRFLARLRLFNRRKATPNAILERYYRAHLYGDRCLYELPKRPMLHMLTTNVSTGVLSVFNRDGLFMAHRGDAGRQKFEQISGRMASIPRVVAASSAFPGFFPPVEITAADLGVPDGEFPTEFFTDGGVYDNMGLRAFSWLKHQDPQLETVLVSDAGKPFQMMTDAALGLIGQSVRASDILWDRVWQLEREIFGHRKGFVFLPITEIVSLSEDPTALPPVIQTELKSIRTDLDRFSNQEVNALAQHGYEVARKVCRQEEVFDVSQVPNLPPWMPIPIKRKGGRERGLVGAQSDTPSRTTRLSRRLRKSSRRRIWTTLFDWRDWPSFVYAAIAFLLLIYAPYQVYSLYQRAQMQAGIIDAIASGDPDIRQILTLVKSNPTTDWVSDEIDELTEPAELNYEGVEVLTHSRIYDLRWESSEKHSSDGLALVYVRDRITLKLLESYSGDGRIVFAFPSRVKEVKIRESNGEVPRVVRRFAQPIEVRGEKRTLYEFEYDLSQVPREESVSVEAELLLEVPQAAKTQFVTSLKTDLISVWILFPLDKPYKNYSLVSYPVDRSAPPKMMNVRYKIDHPYGSLIGWSLVNPQVDYVYECRWELGS